MYYIFRTQKFFGYQVSDFKNCSIVFSLSNSGAINLLKLYFHHQKYTYRTTSQDEETIITYLEVCEGFIEFHDDTP